MNRLMNTKNMNPETTCKPRNKTTNAQCQGYLSGYPYFDEPLFIPKLASDTRWISFELKNPQTINQLTNLKERKENPKKTKKTYTVS